MNPYLVLLGAVLAEVVGTTALEATDGFSNPVPVALVLVGYGCSFYLLSLVLTELPIGPVYATWSAAGIVFVAVAGTLFLDQQLDLAAVAGIVLVVAGVYLLNVVSGVSVN